MKKSKSVGNAYATIDPFRQTVRTLPLAKRISTLGFCCLSQISPAHLRPIQKVARAVTMRPMVHG